MPVSKIERHGRNKENLLTTQNYSIVLILWGTLYGRSEFKVFRERGDKCYIVTKKDLIGWHHDSLAKVFIAQA